MMLPKFELTAAIEADDEAAVAEYQGFFIDSEPKAAWALDKLLSFDERLARVESQYKAIKEGLEADRDRFRSRFLLDLENWAKANPPAKGKTIQLMTGSLCFRTVKGGPRVVVPGEALAWAKAHLPEAVNVKTVESVDADALKYHFETTGELPDGVTFAEPEERLYLKGAS